MTNFLTTSYLSVGKDTNMLAIGNEAVGTVKGFNLQQSRDCKQIAELCEPEWCFLLQKVHNQQG